MIISDCVKIKNSKYYKDIGYDAIEKYISVKIEDLSKGSNVIIIAKCDYCESIKELSYKRYNKNIQTSNKFACSVKCGVLKSKESSLLKWGVDSPNKLESKKEKSKKSLMDKWGVDHVSKLEHVKKSKSDKMKSISDDLSKRFKSFYENISDEKIAEINKKRENTIIEKWGKSNISQVDHIKEKVKNTYSKNWGGFTLESDELKERVKKTNLEKWGDEIPSKTDLIKEKIKRTNLEKWGFENPTQNDDIKNKIKDATLSKYNVVNIMYSEEFRKKFNISNELDYVKYIGNRQYEFFCEYCNKNYDIDYDNYYKRKLRNVSCCTNCYPISENSSIKELDLRNYILSIYSGELIPNRRDGLELNIYLPDLNLGIEFNGLYWHSEEKLDKNYHLNKLNYFKEKNISVINIWEDDWDFRRDIVKSQIKNKLKISDNKIYARNCELKTITDPKIVRDFLNDSHIQGYIRSIIKIGLYYNDELVSLMTFDNSEGRKKMGIGEWNLSRFCSKLNHNVIGGASKLLKYFIKIYNPIRIISFADLDWSVGSLYFNLGFNLVNTLKPDFKYLVDKQRVNKQRFTKSKLIKLGYDNNLTADKITESMNLNKIWNCGQLKFEMIKQIH